MADTESGRPARRERVDSVEEALHHPRAVVIARDGRVVAANDGFLRLLALPDVEGLRPPYPWWPAREERALATVLTHVLAGAISNVEGHPLRLAIQHASGRRILVDVAFHRARGGHVCFTHDPVDEDASDHVDGTRVRAALSLLSAAVHETDAPGPTRKGPSWKRLEPEPSLTEREQQVLAFLLEGERSDRIADALGLSPHTVKHHIQAVFRKHGVKSHVSLLARILGEQDPDERPDRSR